MRLFFSILSPRIPKITLGGFDAFAFDPYNLPSITHAADPLPEVRGALRIPALSLCSSLLRLSSGGRRAIVLGPVT